MLAEAAETVVLQTVVMVEHQTVQMVWKPHPTGQMLRADAAARKMRVVLVVSLLATLATPQMVRVGRLVMADAVEWIRAAQAVAAVTTAVAAVEADAIAAQAVAVQVMQTHRGHRQLLTHWRARLAPGV